MTAVISMGRSLNLRVVAEGVETQEELAFLQAHQCDEAQGYYFSRPVPAGAVRDTVHDRHTSSRCFFAPRRTCEAFNRREATPHIAGTDRTPDSGGRTE